MVVQIIAIWAHLYHLNQEATDFMKCQECQNEMVKFKEGYVQGWLCQNCGWNILTSDIDEPNKYNICIKDVSDDNIDVSVIKTIAQIANVNYLIAKKILTEGNYYIQNLNDTEIEKLKKANIPFEITEHI